ncbi:hypothetical protein LXA43DRAFT_1103565 [Ganoderma leucocontextum]|nr:hypothetical protein LXA43DRAFT_1103565 [Ganoderma leucocontextum]
MLADAAHFLRGAEPIDRIPPAARWGPLPQQNTLCLHGHPLTLTVVGEFDASYFTGGCNRRPALRVQTSSANAIVRASPRRWADLLLIDVLYLDNAALRQMWFGADDIQYEESSLFTDYRAQGETRRYIVNLNDVDGVRSQPAADSIVLEVGTPSPPHCQPSTAAPTTREHTGSTVPRSGTPPQIVVEVALAHAASGHALEDINLFRLRLPIYHPPPIAIPSVC